MFQKCNTKLPKPPDIDIGVMVFIFLYNTKIINVKNINSIIYKKNELLIREILQFIILD